MNLKSAFCAVSFITLVSATHSPANSIYHYQPENVVLEGTLDKQTFAEQPGYESIANGDHEARYWFLKLQTPIDVFPLDPKDPNADDPEKKVRILEMAVLHESDWPTLTKMKKGTHLKLYGSLFHRLTGHHHSRVLIEVNRIER